MLFRSGTTQSTAAAPTVSPTVAPTTAPTVAAKSNTVTKSDNGQQLTLNADGSISVYDPWSGWSGSIPTNSSQYSAYQSMYNTALNGQ